MEYTEEHAWNYIAFSDKHRAWVLANTTHGLALELDKYIAETGRYSGRCLREYEVSQYSLAMALN